jgi:hypothetical protein
MLRGLIMDGHISLNLISLSQLYLYSLHLDSIFTAEHVLTRMVTPSIAS